MKSGNSTEIVVQNKRSSESNQKLVSLGSILVQSRLHISCITIFAGDSFNGHSYSEYHIIRGGLRFNFSVSVFSVLSVYTSRFVPVTLDYKCLLPKFSVFFFHFLSFYFSPGNYSSYSLPFLDSFISFSSSLKKKEEAKTNV